MTQRDVADALRSASSRTGRIEIVTVSRWERGVSSPSEMNLMALAELLDRDPSWFFAVHQEQAA